MEHLAILEKICDNLFDSLEPTTPIYIFAAAIYDTWWAPESTELEKNLAKRVVDLWEAELNQRMIEAYRSTKNDKNRLEADNYYKKWLESYFKLYRDNKGARSAIWHLWESKYGARYVWPI
jgi:hypothetical protein